MTLVSILRKPMERTNRAVTLLHNYSTVGPNIDDFHLGGADFGFARAPECARGVAGVDLAAARSRRRLFAAGPMNRSQSASSAAAQGA